VLTISFRYHIRLSLEHCEARRHSPSCSSGGRLRDMSAIFRPWTNTAAKVSLALLGGGVVGALTLLLVYIRSPLNTDENLQVEQPVEFDHRHHVADDGIDCRYCHASVEKAPSAGIPSTSTCMNCHSQLWNRVGYSILYARVTLATVQSSGTECTGCPVSCTSTIPFISPRESVASAATAASTRWARSPRPTRSTWGGASTAIAMPIPIFDRGNSSPA